MLRISDNTVLSCGEATFSRDQFTQFYIIFIDLGYIFYCRWTWLRPKGLKILLFLETALLFLIKLNKISA